MTIKPGEGEESNWGFGTDDRASLIAGAMYGSAVKAVKEHAASCDIEAERLRKTFSATRAEADRSAAILMFALAEDLMLNGLKQHLHGDVKGGWAEVASGNGLLATANDRITLLALLGWIHPSVYSNLRVLKMIRNRFAHHPDVIGFDEEKVRSHIAALSAVEKEALQAMAIAADRVLSPRQLYLVRASNTIAHLVVNLTVSPVVQKQRVALEHVLEVGWAKLPPNFQELYRMLADHMLAVIEGG